MAQDADQLVVGASGHIWVGETTDAAPTTATSVLAGGWLDLGYSTDAGVQFHNVVERKSVIPWNQRRPIRRIAGNASTTIDFALLQWNTATWEFAIGGDVTGGGATYEVQAVNLAGFGGTDDFHLTYGGSESADIVRGTNYTAAGIKAAIEGISGFTTTVTVSPDTLTDTGFIITFDETGTRSAFTVTNPTGCTGTVGQIVAGAAAAGSEYLFTPSEDDDYRSLCIDFADQGRSYRIYVPRGAIASDVTLGLTQSDESPIPVSFEALPNEGDSPWLQFNDDPSFA